MANDNSTETSIVIARMHELAQTTFEPIPDFDVEDTPDNDKYKKQAVIMAPYLRICGCLLEKNDADVVKMVNEASCDAWLASQEGIQSSIKHLEALLEVLHAGNMRLLVGISRYELSNQ